MKCQNLTAGKKNKTLCLLLKIVSRVLSVKVLHYILIMQHKITQTFVDDIT